MNAKLLRILTLLFFSAGLSYTPVSLSATKPKCYEKIQDFLILQFGENFQQDENIVRVNVIDTKLTMIIDKTPTINPSRYFFYTRKNDVRACLVLTAPIANDVDFSKPLINGAPVNITTRSAGQGSNDVTIQYKWIASKQLYMPAFCAHGIGTRKRFASCKSIHSKFGQ
jgi:hypothetical protein